MQIYSAADRGTALRAWRKRLPLIFDPLLGCSSERAGARSGRTLTTGLAVHNKDTSFQKRELSLARDRTQRGHVEPQIAFDGQGALPAAIVARQGLHICGGGGQPWQLGGVKRGVAADEKTRLSSSRCPEFHAQHPRKVQATGQRAPATDYRDCRPL